jgi:hypothetical protein
LVGRFEAVGAGIGVDVAALPGRGRDGGRFGASCAALDGAADGSDAAVRGGSGAGTGATPDGEIVVFGGRCGGADCAATS